jgi:hypothetical protein
MAEFHFRSMEASHIESDVTIEFLVGDLVIHFAGIFHLSFSVQKLFKNYYSKKLNSLNSSVMDDKYDTYKTANIEINQ